MTIETVPIDSVSPDPANVRRHPQRNLDSIKGSLLKFGQVKPIVVDQRGIVLAGNGTLQAARELGWQTIAVVRTNLSGSAAVSFSIADNRTSETSEWDEISLGNVLAALQMEDAGLADATGFSPDEIAALVGGSPQGQEPEAAPEDFPEVDEDIHTDYCCPKCGYAWSGKAAG